MSSGDKARRAALLVDVVESDAEPATSGARSVGPRMRATIASYRCTRSLELQDFQAARLEYWVLQQALEELRAQHTEISVDESVAALQARARDLARMLAMRVTPREFRRSSTDG